MRYYIASCAFTAQFPELSKKIQDYISARGDTNIVRCCVTGWKKKIYEEKMPEGELGECWKALPHSEEFTPDDEVWSLCPNCMNIVQEWRGVKQVHSLWELIDHDDKFPFPNLSGLQATLQDCWRLREYSATHDAVRSLLRKMNVSVEELPINRNQADFCGKTLYRPQVERNPKLAPRHYRDEAEGLFLPHSEEEQNRIMAEYCEQFTTKTVICYCHYCLEGLLVGGVDGHHLAELLFEPYSCK